MLKTYGYLGYIYVRMDPETTARKQRENKILCVYCIICMFVYDGVMRKINVAIIT